MVQLTAPADQRLVPDFFLLLVPRTDILNGLAEAMETIFSFFYFLNSQCNKQTK